MSILDRVCPVCDALYGDHSLDDLAECMETALGEWGPEVETVTGPTLERVL